MQTRARALWLAAAATFLVACGSSTSPASKIVNFTANMVPGNEPAVTGNPTGSGTFTATLDTSTNVFTYSATFSGLSTNITAGHIHGPFPNGQTSAGVILNFGTVGTFTGVGTTSGSVSGTVTLNSATQFTSAVNGDSLRKLLLAGAVYVNIHTQQNPAGEIRGQISIK